VAISNHRIKIVDDNSVTFSYKDYKTGAQVKEMMLSLEEFVRRFSQHILPKGLVRIRHYGILSSTWKRARLPELKEKLGQKSTEKNSNTQRVRPCKCGTSPGCKTGNLRTILSFDQRGLPVDRPPALYKEMWNRLNLLAQA
jgi:hypothetical protein